MKTVGFSTPLGMYSPHTTHKQKKFEQTIFPHQVKHSGESPFSPGYWRTILNDLKKRHIAAPVHHHGTSDDRLLHKAALRTD